MTKYILTDKNVLLEVLETDIDIRELFATAVKWQICQQADAKAGDVYRGGRWVDPSSVVDAESLAEGERLWRDRELIRADEELNKVQDSDPKARGTVTDWRSYRKNLRSLPDMQGFPTSHVRPVAPDA